MKKLTPQKAASEERNCIRKMLTREARKHTKMGYLNIAEYIQGLIAWIDKRDDRYNKKLGGLGK